MKQITKPTLVFAALLAVGFASGAATGHEAGKQGTSATMPMHGMGMGDAHGSAHGQGFMHGSGMMQGHGSYHGDQMMGGHGMMGHSGMMSGHGMMGNMLSSFDGDNDGSVSPDEMREGMSAKMKEFDSDGDGTINLEEFEAFHAAMIRNMVVDHFQVLDEDGDGQITGQEMNAPADRMERMQNMQKRHRDNHMGGGQQSGMGNGHMMDQE